MLVTSGVVVTGVRRTPGLRREEVATLAGISADYYLRLEQGRDRNPSAQVLDALAEFGERVRSGEWTGITGKKVDTVVNIGIGGSDLGPAMISAATGAIALVVAPVVASPLAMAAWTGAARSSAKRTTDLCMGAAFP